MSRRGLVLFLSLGVIWGIPYLLVKVAVSHLSPAMLVLARTGVAGLLLLPIAGARGELGPALRGWKPLLAYTAAELVVPWYLLSSAEERLPSATTALLVAAVPIVGVGVAFAIGRAARLSPLNWTGLLVGLAGVAALVGFDVRGSDLGAVGEVAVVAVGYALGPAILARWLHDRPALGVVTLSLVITALIYVPVVFLTGGWPAHMPPGQTVGAVIALAVVCSAGAFILMLALVAEIGPVRATAITYINPAVAIVVGALFLGETITAWTLVGFLLVLAGSWLVTRGANGTDLARDREVLRAPGLEHPEPELLTARAGTGITPAEP